MKKIIAAAMTVVLLLPAGCSMLSGKTICLFNGSNILGLKSVLYKSGRIILDLDEAYADTENSEYADLIGLVKNGTAEDRANFSLSVRTTCFTDFSDNEIKFDVSGLTVSVNAGENIDKMETGSKKIIYGTYILKYSIPNDRLYYEFILNRYTRIDVDAHTGEIFDYEIYDIDIYLFQDIEYGPAQA